MGNSQMTDFEFSISVIDNFFEKRKIRRSLSIIGDQGISGWEVWLQIEFATFLSEFGDEIEWEREREIFTDRRKEKFKNKVAADFILRRKGFKRDRFIVLEFKQHNSLTSCITNMVKDVEKIEKIKESDIDMRSFWVVGVHGRNGMSKSDITDQVFSSVDFVKDVYTNFIPNTKFAYTIF